MAGSSTILKGQRLLSSPVVSGLRWFRRHRAGPLGAEWDIWSDPLLREARAWNRAKRIARNGPRVLMATSHGGSLFLSLLESSLAIALTLRGARVEIALCNSVLPACQMSESWKTPATRLLGKRPQPSCETCELFGRTIFTPLGLRIHWLGKMISPARQREAMRLAGAVPQDTIGAFAYDGLAVGEHAMAGALRYFARGDIEDEPLGSEVLRLYLEAALRTAFGLEDHLRRQSYDVACFNHGLYVPQGVIGEVCRRRGLRVVTWNPAYRTSSFIFSHGDTYHHTMMSEPTEAWERLPWSPSREEETLQYLSSRRHGGRDWINFHDSRPREDVDVILADMGVDRARPWVAMLTNVVWDAQLHYPANAFPSMRQWVIETIRYFAQRPDLQLIIRVHPAEIRGANPSRQLMADEIRREIPVLPDNVVVVPPDSPLSTYALVERCNAAIIYGTKAGIEIASMGIPVIVAGEAWVRNKGFSLDAQTRDEYLALLTRLPLRDAMSASAVERARKYAFHIFFRRMIPLPFIRPGRSGKPKVDVGTLDELAPGRHPGLDVICEGILHGTPFIYPAELLDSAEAEA